MIKSAGMKGAQESVSDLLIVIKDEVEPKKILPISNPGLLIKLDGSISSDKVFKKREKSQKKKVTSSDDTANHLHGVHSAFDHVLTLLRWKKAKATHKALAIFFSGFLISIVFSRVFYRQENIPEQTKFHCGDFFDRKYTEFDQFICQKQRKIGMTNWTYEFAKLERPAFKTAYNLLL
jgi:hypothetical protein